MQNLKTIGGHVTGFGRQVWDGIVYQTILLRLALTQLNTRLYHVLFIKVGQSIKVELIVAQLKLGAIGQQLLTIVHKIRQHVSQALKQGN